MRLFHRSTRSITLTAEGLLFLDRSRRILAEIEAAENELSQNAATPRGRLRISLPLAGTPFLHAIAAFKKAFPDVDLDLDFSDRQVDVIDEGFDAVVRSGEALDSRLTARRLGDFRMLVVASPVYLQERMVPLHPADLASHACIQFRFPNTGKMQAWPLQDGETFVEPDLPLSVVCNNLDARIDFALSSIGVAYLPDFSILDHLREGRLVAVLDDFARERGTFHILWPSGKRITPKLRVFIDFMAENLFRDHDI